MNVSDSEGTRKSVYTVAWRSRQDVRFVRRSLFHRLTCDRRFKNAIQEAKYMYEKYSLNHYVVAANLNSCIHAVYSSYYWSSECTFTDAYEQADDLWLLCLLYGCSDDAMGRYRQYISHCRVYWDVIMTCLVQWLPVWDSEYSTA